MPHVSRLLASDVVGFGSPLYRKNDMDSAVIGGVVVVIIVIVVAIAATRRSKAKSEDSDSRT